MSFLRALKSAGHAMRNKTVKGFGYRGLLPTASYSTTRMKAVPHPSEGFLTGTSSVYIEEMYNMWKDDPSSVHGSWNVYFKNVDAGLAPGIAFTPPPSIQGQSKTPVFQGAQSSTELSSDVVNVLHLVRAYQVRGHEAAKLNPLRIYVEKEHLLELDLKQYGFSEADLDRSLKLSGLGNISSGILSSIDGENITLRQLVDKLENIYCGSMGIEYMHIRSREECNWIRERVEVDHSVLPKEKKNQILDRLNYADTFEYFLSQKFNTAKRFGVEGNESVIAGMKAMIDRSTELGVENIVMGMPHRGRLNVLANVIRKPLELIFKEFAGTHFIMDQMDKVDVDGDGIEDWSGSGDVKYHLGTNFSRQYPDGRQVNLSLLANPSHLEAVDPLVIGNTRCKQYLDGDKSGGGDNALAVLLHGDAAFAGQGIVYETMQMAMLDNYKTGGTVHVVINNQIGFTTDMKDSRSTLHCSDIGKGFDCPILHVNADDPEMVCRAFTLAAEFRQKFHRDVIVDVIGYRRHGHNELDQPMFTQPSMYNVIKRHPSALKQYQSKLISEGSLTAEEVEVLEKKVWNTHSEAYDNSSDYVPTNTEWMSSKWSDFKIPGQMSRISDTGVAEDRLKAMGVAMSTIPKQYKPHRNIQKIFDTKLKSFTNDLPVDWATAEALAFGSLMQEGNHVRISGQDVQRGTFSHRHAVVHCQDSYESYCPLNHIPGLDDGSVPEQLVASNSPLSEMGVLGFELGYSYESPKQLTLWEAQFGDFTNGAQVIIDNFLGAGESKWMRQSALTMLLPHGYDGQGAEHSSCRVERFLQNCDDDPDSFLPMDETVRQQIQLCNWQIVNCTTPANYFHVLRRQLHREFRKPLIVVAPKNMLKLKACQSPLEAMIPGTKFQRVIGDPSTDILSNDDISKVCFVSGKLYYELVSEREKRGAKDTAFVRLEQIAPFPFDKVAAEVSKYSNATDVCYVQEEPKNMGAYSYVLPRFQTATDKILGNRITPRYIGRLASASPATGKNKKHFEEQEAIYNAVFE